MAAALSITPASVVTTAGGIDKNRTAGETVTAGQAVYVKDSDGKWYLAQADGTAAEAVFGGIALHAASAGQPLAVLTAGSITIGATVTVGTVYYLHGTAGGIGLFTDLASTNKVTVVGYGATASVLFISPILTGVAIP